MSDPTITYYGERGIVNGIILDIKDDLEKQKKFLKAIKLADKSSLDWIDDAAQFHWFIEPSLSQFGNPDIILTVETNAKIKYAFFIEAKIIGYDSSSCPLDSKLTLDKYDNGVASKLNVQLAFKYRFVEAMFACKNLSEKIKHIKESEESAKQYNDEKQRSLSLIPLCEHLNTLFEGIDKDNIYYIALTNDKNSSEPFKNEDTRRVVQVHSERGKDSSEPFKNEDTLPPITRPNWEKNKNKFGFLTYKSLESMEVIYRQSGFYKAPADFMFGIPASDHMEFMGEQVLTSTKFETWSDDQKDLAKKAKEVIGDTIDNLNPETPIKPIDNKGSYSYEYKGEIILKILTYKNQKEKIVIGLRADQHSKNLKHTFERTLYLIGGGNRKAFWCYPAENENDISKLSKVIEEYLTARMSGQ